MKGTVLGHQRLGTLPRTKKWQRVVEMIGGGADMRDIAEATSAAAERDMIDAGKDEALRHAFWLLTQIPLAARMGEHFIPELRMLGLKLSDRPSLVEIVTALTDAVDRHVRTTGGRTDLGEMAQLSAAESLNAVASRELPGLFGTSFEDVRGALAGLGTPDQFSVLSRDFFARLTRRHLGYYLSRELPNHVGVGKRFQTAREHKEFEGALDTHTRETARIVKEFSRDWFSKSNYEGGIDQDKAARFGHVAFDKIRRELRKRRDADG